MTETKANPKHELATMKNVGPYINKIKGQISSALPSHMNAERLARIALTELRTTPKLMQCTCESILKCIMISAQLGLEPGLLGHVYFVPYGREATVIIGYKGMIDLARRSGQIKSIEARVVYENDKCSVKYGLESTIEHEVDIRCPDRGNVIGYYAIAKLIGGGEQFEFMNVEEVKKVKNQSKAGNSGPWVTHFDEMAKKTVIRKLFKYLPVSIEIQRASTMDEGAEIGSQKQMLDAEFDFDIDPETGEILNTEETSQADSIADKLK